MFPERKRWTPLLPKIERTKVESKSQHQGVYSTGGSGCYQK